MRGRSDRVAIVDVGSNSIRLVVYEGRTQPPVLRFNEKILCGLGRGLQRSGLLNPDGIAMALRGLARFRALLDAMDVAEVEIVATEAVRAAANGAAFVARAEAVIGDPIRILDGEGEARHAALGVISGFWRPSGLVADIGGGSLELASLAEGRIERLSSLPLGVLRVMDVADGDLARARGWIEAQLAPLQTFLDAHAGRSLYVVGGNWRALARIDMAERRSPIRVLHGYRLPRGEATELGRRLARLDPRQLAALAGTPRKRVDTIPTAALLFELLVRAVRPEDVRFSAHGLREGLLLARLSWDELDRDPLLLAAADEGRRHNRDPAMGDALAAWTAPLFPGEDRATARLRVAACHLADRAWRDHPDSRARQAAAWISQAPLTAIDHTERAFLAMTMAIRHESDATDPALAPLDAMLDPAARRLAERLGRTLLLGLRLSGATAAMLARTRLVRDEQRLTLELPGDGSMPSSDAVDERVRAVARSFELGAWAIVERVDPPVADAAA